MRTKIFTLILLVLSVIPAFADELSDLPSIVGVNGDNQVVLFQNNSQTTINDRPLSAFAYARPVWSPDGTKVAYFVADSPQTSQSWSIYIWDGQQSINLFTSDKLGTGFPLTWSLDSTQVIFSAYAGDPAQPTQDFTVAVDVMAINADAQTEPQRIGDIGIHVGCGGGSDSPVDWAYWADTSLGGSHEAFFMTASGLVFSQQCVGTDAALYNFQTGETTVLADGGVGRVEISPDGMMLAGVKDNQLIRLNLQTLVWEIIPTTDVPDQLAWGKNGELFYSIRFNPLNMLDSLSADERQKVTTAYGYEITEMMSLSIQIWQVGADQALYVADSYAVGRMAVTPDGKGLIFSSISNLDKYLNAILTGAYDPMGGDLDARADYVSTDIYSLNLTNGEVALVTEKLSQFAMAG